MAAKYNWIKQGAKCRWNDPALKNYSEEEREQAQKRIFTIYEVWEEDKMALICDGYTEAEVYFREIKPITEEELIEQGGFLNETQMESLADEMTATALAKAYGKRYQNLENIEEDKEINEKWESINSAIYTLLHNEFAM